MTVTPICNPREMIDALVRRELPILEKRLEEFDLVNDHVDWERICRAKKERAGSGYRATIITSSQEQDLGFFTGPRSPEYLKVMRELESFIESQGPEPLMIYGFEQFPTQEQGFDDSIIVCGGIWRGIEDFKRQLYD